MEILYWAAVTLILIFALIGIMPFIIIIIMLAKLLGIKIKISNGNKSKRIDYIHKMILLKDL